MLYSGKLALSSLNREIIIKKHQDKLPYRVSQATINQIVESQLLCCTHYDAWRFFQNNSQDFNPITPMSRDTQILYEQPACIHANMDLFKYAYQLYPLVPSNLLLRSLKLAIKARIIDMRASPYDVSGYEECREAICVETEQGRRQYVHEQEQLAKQAAVIRRELLDVYLTVENVIRG
mmetsp:Transcript_37197/g.37877  ORF Transcript_37197/g.37877 Transcript_37197/m.37877 type:complete len:178 (+) Transcript_37197:648-1181(+)